jgi:hypothetical protein
MQKKFAEIFPFLPFWTFPKMAYKNTPKNPKIINIIN